jgi:hypothetical protein
MGCWNTPVIDLTWLDVAAATARSLIELIDLTWLDVAAATAAMRRIGVEQPGD